MKNFKVFVTVIVLALFAIISITVHAAGGQRQASLDPDNIRKCVVTMKQTEYNAGDKLSLDGLQMQIYDYWGNIWTYSGDDLVTDADEIEMNPVFDEKTDDETEEESNISYDRLHVSLKGYEEKLYDDIDINIHNVNDDMQSSYKDKIHSIYANKITTVYNVNDTLDVKDIAVYGESLDRKIRKLNADEYTVDTSNVDMGKEDEYGNYEIKVTYNDKNSSSINISCSINVYVVAKKAKLTMIEAKKEKTTYEVGDTIDVDDIVVTGYYDDGSSKVIEPYSEDNWDGYAAYANKIDTSKVGEQNLEIQVMDGCNLKECSVTISIMDSTETKKQLTELQCKSGTPVYEVGADIALKDFQLVVTAVYSDETTRILSENEYTTNIDELDTKAEGTYKLTISYTENDITKTTTATYVVGDFENVEKTLSKIVATKDNVEYEVDDTIDLDDLNVIAFYSDGTTKKLTKDEYTTNAASLKTTTAGKVTLKVTYKEGDVTKTSSIVITVKEKSDGTEETEKTLSKITAAKTTKEYQVGDTITTDDLTVTATYSDGTTRTLDEDEYTTNVASLKTTTAGKVTLEVFYTEGNITKTSSIEITVKEKSDKTEEDEEILSKITAVKTTKEYQVGDTITIDDLTVTAEYSDGTTKKLDKNDYTTNVASLKTTAAGKVTLEVFYSEGNIIKTSSIVITIKEKTPSTPSQPTTPTQPETPSQPTTPTQPETPSQPTTSTPSETEDTAKAVPGKVKVIKVKALGKKKISVKWKEAKNGIAYRVQISTKKNFRGAKKKMTLDTSCTIKNLKKGKTYYVRIQAASFDKKWSSWSAVKKVKVK